MLLPDVMPVTNPDTLPLVLVILYILNLYFCLEICIVIHMVPYGYSKDTDNKNIQDSPFVLCH